MSVAYQFAIMLLILVWEAPHQITLTMAKFVVRFDAAEHPIGTLLKTLRTNLSLGLKRSLSGVGRNEGFLVL